MSFILTVLLPVAVVTFLGFGWRMIWVWVSHHTDAPIMNERINAGSDRFFEQRDAEETRLLAGRPVSLDEFDNPITRTWFKRPPTG